MPDTNDENVVLAKSEWEAAYEAGRLSVGVIKLPDGRPAAIIPDNYGIEDLERYMTFPVRIEKTVEHLTVDSFIRYVQEYTDTNYKQIIVGSPSINQIRAHLDYHKSQSKPTWNTHKAIVTLQQSIEWKRWTAKNGQAMDQKSFVEFLEDNYADILEPDSAAVLEAAKALDATKTVTFKSGVNISNGTAQLTYNEEVTGKGSGNVDIPTAFVLGIPVYEGNDPFRIKMKLRYRISEGGKLSFTYVMDNPQKILRDEFDTVLKHIEEKTTIQPYIGLF